MLKQLLHRISILLLLSASVAHLSAATDCSGYSPDYLDHYCECNAAQRISDLSGLSNLTFSDSIWFRTGTQTFTEAGMTAYLFSESDVQVDIYQRCESIEKLYSFLVPKNQTRDLDKQTIQEKFEQNGGSLGMNMAIRVLFYPTEPGAECRLMCYPYNTGPNSTPEAPLPVLVGMTYVSSHAYDVYELQPDHIPASCALFTQWNDANNNSCHLRITRGSTNGTVVAEHDFLDADSYFVFDSQLLKEVRNTGESLYMHYTHDAAAAGRIITQEILTTDIMTDIVLCQGKTWEYNGQQYTQPIVIPYDTVWTSTISMDVYKYNVTFAAPELQRDTLALRTNQLPYNYRGQTITAFGDYDILLHTPSECDEHIALHVRHNLTTIHSVIDTTLCQGAIYVATDGKRYTYDVTLVDSLWQGRDTLYVTRTNVSFSAMDVVYDTLAVKNTELAKGVRLYSKYKVSATVYDFGDYKYIMIDAHNCPDSLYLHVCHNLKVVRDTVEKIFCEGTIYEHNGVEYTSSVTLVDTVFSADGDTQTITTTQVLFVTNEIHYDTLYLKTTDLPYTYRGVALKTFGEHHLSFDYGDCDQQVQLTIFHDIDTLMQFLDTTFCQGNVFTYKGQDITTDIAFLDTAMYNADTCIITSVSATFTAPEATPDTLALKQAALPYLYRGQKSITDFGDYDLTLHTSGECDERYLLHVYHHVDTLYETISETLCQGKAFTYKEEDYTSTTSFVDTTLYNADTCIITSVSVNFDEPELYTEYIGLKVSDLPYTYRGLTDTITHFGDYDITIHTLGECDEKYLVHVYHKIDTLRHTVDTTLCQGKIFEYEGKQYTEDTTFIQKLRLDDDTYQITTINLMFVEPDPQHISLPLKYSNLPYTYCGLTDTITAFGDYDLTIYTSGECNERHLLHVYHKPDTLYNRVDSAVCGKSFKYEGKVYTEERRFVKHLQYNQDTLMIDTLHVYFTTEVTDVFKSISLKSTQLPYSYPLPNYKNLTIKEFGNYDTEPYDNYTTWCKERLHLQVIHDIDTLYEAVSETLCQGKVYTYNGVEYTADVTFVDTLQRDADTYVITSVSVTFTAPEATPDALALKQAEFPYLYRGQETINDFGDYDFTIHTAGECDERYLLHVYHAIDTLYETINETLCQGKSFTYKGIDYTSNTTFVDTAILNVDTCVITSVSVAFTAPDISPDTLGLKHSDLPYTYRDQYTIPVGGLEQEFDVLIHTLGSCDEHYRLYVYHDIDTLYETVSETLCQGKVFTYKEVDYTSTTSFVDTTMYNADTCIITSVSLTFTAPEAILDTLGLKHSDLPYTYRNQYTIPAGGLDQEYDVIIHTLGSCDEHYRLYVYHNIDTLYESVSETLCQGKVFTYKEVDYTSTTSFMDTTMYNADTCIITSVSLTFTAPEAIPDTLYLKTTDLPYSYRGLQDTITAFGNYELTIHQADACDEHYLLHVYHSIDTLYLSIDTILCEGRIFNFEEQQYTTSTTLYDSTWLNDDTWQFTTLDLAFAVPEMEYDTIWESTEQLLKGYCYEPADTMVYAAGEYFYEILEYDNCTRHITLTVNANVSTILENISNSNRPQLIMRDGMVYILYGEEYFTILGMKLGTNKNTNFKKK